jgi:hypothetical protein
MSKKLDRSKDIGTVTPPYKGAVFYQDGYYFDAGGSLCKHMIDPAQEKAKKAGANKKAKKASQTKAPVQTPPSMEPEVPIPSDPVPTGDPLADPGDVDLTAWALQQEQYPWFSVRKAIRDRYSRQVSNKAGAIDLLIERDVVTSAQIEALAG